MPKAKPPTRSVPTMQQAVYSGNQVEVEDGTGEFLTLDNLDLGTDLLDRTDPAHPKYAAAGVYAITAQFSGAKFKVTEGGNVQYTLNPSDASVIVSECSLARATEFPFEDTQTVIVQAAAGDAFNLAVFNGDGGGDPINFNVSCLILVKLS